MKSEEGKTNHVWSEQTNIRIVREYTTTFDYGNKEATDIPTVQRLYSRGPNRRKSKIYYKCLEKADFWGGYWSLISILSRTARGNPGKYIFVPEMTP